MGIDNVLQIQTKENEDLLTLCSLGHHLGYVWGMAGACLGHHLEHVWDNNLGKLPSMANNGQKCALTPTTHLPESPLKPQMFEEGGLSGFSVD